MNRLQFEKSPYLLQHKDNPVDWYPWGDEAISRARQEDKPILVSIGYSSCHWCHVMEHESFNDEKVAAYMNENFICIKLDREERPDLDKIYMDAVVSLNGSGGWPLNCFLLPNLKPFYGGTYFPPNAAHQRPSWSQILQFIAGIYKDRRSDVEDQAERMLDYIKNSSNTIKEIAKSNNKPLETDIVLKNLTEHLKSRFDRANGGFGGAPKFPGTMTLNLLLDLYFYSGDQDCIHHAIQSLNKIGKAGIYDQVAGGFARYATDKEWNIPHFEKMLYDNAQFLSIYSKAYKIFRSDFYKTIVEETTTWLEESMKSPLGGYYSAIDADSEGVEGKFYTWTTDELKSQLTPEEYQFIKSAFDIQEEGNWDDPFHPSEEPKNILWLKKNYDENLRCSEKFHRLMVKLKGIRIKRIHPLTDTKIIVAWNSLLVKGWIDAYEALPSENNQGQNFYLDKALTLLDFIHVHCMNEVLKLHQYNSHIPAMLDDIAFTISADIQAFQISGNQKYLDLAVHLITYTLEHYFNKETESFIFSISPNDLIAQTDDLFDNTMPAASGAMAANLIKAGRLLGNLDWENLGIRMIESLEGSILKYPESMSHWMSLVLAKRFGFYEIKIKEFSIALFHTYLPHLIIHDSKSNEPGISLCHKFICEMPVDTIEKFRLLLDKHYHTTWNGLI